MRLQGMSRHVLAALMSCARLFGVASCGSPVSEPSGAAAEEPAAAPNEGTLASAEDCGLGCLFDMYDCVSEDCEAYQLNVCPENPPCHDQGVNAAPRSAEGVFASACGIVADVRLQPIHLKKNEESA